MSSVDSGFERKLEYYRNTWVFRSYSLGILSYPRTVRVYLFSRIRLDRIDFLLDCLHGFGLNMALI